MARGDAACSFCGATHPRGSIGREDGWLPGIEFKACPEIPKDHFYVDADYAQGPRGALFSLVPDKEAKDGG